MARHSFADMLDEILLPDIETLKELDRTYGENMSIDEMLQEINGNLLGYPVIIPEDDTTSYNF